MYATVGVQRPGCPGERLTGACLRRRRPRFPVVFHLGPRYGAASPVARRRKC